MKSILFVKTSSLGDVVHNCPAVSDVARGVPQVEIDWVVEEPFAAIAAMHASVRRVIPIAIRRWRSALWNPAVWSEIRAFRQFLRDAHYEVVIDTQSLLKSALVTAFTSGKKHGMDRRSAREPLAARFYDVTHDVPRALHAVERNRRLAAASLGYAFNGKCHYGLRAPGRGGSDEIVFLTMTSRADKLWPERNWIELGRSLGANIVLPWGTSRERRRAERIAAAISDAVVPERMALDELAKRFVRARAVVGLDTGLTHLAAALGVRTVGIYCSSDPALTGLYGVPGAKNLGGPGTPPAVSEVLQSLA